MRAPVPMVITVAFHHRHLLTSRLNIKCPRMTMQEVVIFMQYFQPYVSFFTWNCMAVSYLNSQNGKIPGKANYQAVEEFFGIPMPQVRHIVLHKGIMDIMSTVA